MANFNPLEHTVCLTFPARLAPTTWAGHVPFAMLLVDLLRPRVVVELGTYYGVSYCAFCQAVKELGVEASCYAIDTWEGDTQSGFYGAEVLADLKAHHDSLYANFSRLIESTFDEAAQHFTDGTIDLLHIDGFHTYERVKRDYETWLPKMSARGVILFHDINVREKDFGVWKFWEERKAEYPHFEFRHSHGLGVLAVGESYPNALRSLLEASEEEAARVRDFFFHLGARLEAAQGTQALKSTVAEQARQLEAWQLQAREQKARLDSFERRLREAEQDSTDVLRRLEEATRRAQQSEELQRASEQKLVELNRQLETERAELETRSQLLEERTRQLEETKRQLRDKTRELYARDWLIQEKALARQHEAHGENGSDGEPSSGRIFKLVAGVVTFNNSREQLGQLLKSLEVAAGNLSEMPVEVEIFVTDNGEESVWPESNLRLAKFDSQGNVGFGKAMNRMMSAAFADPRAEWFLCLNPDGALHYKALTELLVMSSRYPDSLIEARQFPEEHLKPYDPETLETPWASGACLLLRRRVRDTIGGFDPNFFMYLEDVDLSWRARVAGLSVKVAPNSLFGHDVLGRKPDASADRALLLSGRYLAHKWGNAEFLEWAERELVARGYFASPSALPPLPAARFEHSSVAPDVTDFAHYFHFSQARW